MRGKRQSVAGSTPAATFNGRFRSRRPSEKSVIASDGYNELQRLGYWIKETKNEAKQGKA
jgi:hypothetical protein